jgi:DNA modification methylase
MSLPRSYEEWIGQRVVAHYGTNAGAPEVPFQSWHKVKEAFTPELVARAVRANPRPTQSCLDPFGGSGTTALTCQFLGVTPTTYELNPFLADLIQSKLETYDSDLLARDLAGVLKEVRLSKAIDSGAFDNMPPSFVESLDQSTDRWLFDRSIAEDVIRTLSAIQNVQDERNRLFFKVLLGSVLVPCSNVVISGKGRRYRGNWKDRRRPAGTLLPQFTKAVHSAMLDVVRFGRREEPGYSLKRGDSRVLIKQAEPADLAVFSPPYPNSFDYTDVYNVELWMLGYLKGPTDNRNLRGQTVSSHVQVSREFNPAPTSSAALNDALASLHDRMSQLWNPWLPSMVGAYFAEMDGLLTELRRIVMPGGSIWIVVGDSRYAGVPIASGAIVAELAQNHGLTPRPVEVLREMRGFGASGSARHLTESLVVLDVPLVS